MIPIPPRYTLFPYTTLFRSPLQDALEEISSDARREYAQMMKVTAAKATPKVSMVVTTTILPAALLLVASALILGNARSEEHTSELQSRGHLVCRLLL